MRGIFGKKSTNTTNTSTANNNNADDLSDDSPSSPRQSPYSTASSSASSNTTDASSSASTTNAQKQPASVMGTFWKRATTVGKHKIMKTIGKAEEIEFPDDFIRANQAFKDSQTHYKEMDKLLRKFTKSSQSHSEDELTLGTQFKEYAATLKLDYVSGESFAPPRTLYTNLEVNKMFNMFDQLGCCLEQLSELRSNMNNDVSSILLSKVHEAMEEGDACKNLKEYYREAVVEHNVDVTRYNTLKQKSNDLVKIKNAEKDAEEKQKLANQVHENIMKELQYQEELRDYEYLNAIRQFISVYRTYFIQGSQVLDELESHLITGKSRSAMRSYDVNDIINYKEIQNQQAQQAQQAQQSKPKKPKEDKQVFGVPLTTVMKRERELNRDVVPNMCVDLFEFLELKGLDVEGIFRLAGEVVGVSYVKKMYDNGKKHLDLGGMIATKEFKDIHVVSSLLKMYLREMPEPLLTYERYDSFLKLLQLKDESEIGYGMLNLVKQLPIEHIAMLDKLMRFLKKVADRSDVNKMTMSNLSIVFGVNILKSADNNPMRMAKDSQAINKTCELLIGLYEDYIGIHVKDQIEQFRQQRIQKFQTISAQTEETYYDPTINEPFNAFEEESKKKGFLPPPSRTASMVTSPTTGTQPQSVSASSSPSTKTMPLPSRPQRLPPQPPKPTPKPTSTPPVHSTSVSFGGHLQDDGGFVDVPFNSTNDEQDPFAQFDNEQKNKKSSSNLYPSVNNTKWEDPNDFF
ncbi:hypothetical protein C9374_007636 [Naegleria lovaniensis]|uniref:Rho-GAP domain-containing protein n=1 Tax=Naegleria lovaniensis TaxID=51637 RepID=A0AA88GMI5_NAELO|nr:uncharacterized protein C9374_007636 [Naegleria lovaniensis]KAG2378998.1 hypothetical protein C9374_007636 [Naegleria lovaniensis]